MPRRLAGAPAEAPRGFGGRTITRGHSPPRRAAYSAALSRLFSFAR